MSAYGITVTTLATQLAEAVLKDEAPEEGGFDLSAGMFGKHVSGWIRATATELDNRAAEIAKLRAPNVEVRGARRNEMDTTWQPWPVCPHCGHKHEDAWEWDLGPGLEGDGEYECGDCGKPFFVSRSVTIYYTTKTGPNK